MFDWLKFVFKKSDKKAGVKPSQPCPRMQSVERVGPTNSNERISVKHNSQDDDFITSAAVGMMTNNAVIGGVVGGSFTGGIVGDIANDGCLGPCSDSHSSSCYDSSSSYDSGSSCDCGGGCD